MVGSTLNNLLMNLSSARRQAHTGDGLTTREVYTLQLHAQL